MVYVWMNSIEETHLKSEEAMAFETPAGKIYLEAGDESMTPFGGFVPLAAFIKKLGVLDGLGSSCPVERKSPNASRAGDVIGSFFLTTLIDGTRFVHVERLREDPLLKELFGMERVLGDDTIRRFFQGVEAGKAREWIAGSTRFL